MALPFEHFQKQILPTEEHMLMVSVQKVAVNIHWQRRQLDTLNSKAWRLAVP